MAESKKLIKYFPPSGTRDFLPQDMLFRNWLMDKWKQTSLKFGCQEYDTPVVEHSDLWTFKTGNADILKEMFTFETSGVKLCLRPEMTPSLARIMLNYLPTAILPLKLFSVPQCWRNEDTSRGRKREFYQWNVDTFGGEAVKVELDILMIIIDFLKSIGLTSNDVVIRISNRMIIEKVLLNNNVTQDKIIDAFLIIDKIEKLSREELSELLKDNIGMEDKGIESIYNLVNVRTIQDLKNYLDENDETFKQIQQLYNYCDNLKLTEWLQLDLSIVRGLAYYTGFVFEGFFKNSTLKRAICGGGTYNKMMQDFGYNSQVSACGFGLGDVVIQEVLLELNRMPNLKLQLDYVIIPFNDDYYVPSCLVANKLREKDKTVDVYSKGGKRHHAFSYADRKNARYTVFIAPSEWSENKIVVKDLLEKDVNKKQQTVNLDSYINTL